MRFPAYHYRNVVSSTIPAGLTVRRQALLEQKKNGWRCGETEKTEFGGGGTRIRLDVTLIDFTFAKKRKKSSPHIPV